MEQAKCPNRQYAQLEGAIRSASEKETPVRMEHQGAEKWMNGDMKRARRERNAFRRDMGRRKKHWVAKNHEVKSLTREAKTRVVEGRTSRVLRRKDVRLEPGG